jgi:DNA-binding response OmpR family regulator
MPSVLILDDDPLILKALERAFRSAGWQVHTAAQPLAHPDGYALVDCVLSDWDMPQGGGQRVKQESAAPVVIYSANDLAEHDYVIRKPAAVEDLVAELHRAIDERRALRGDVPTEVAL